MNPLLQSIMNERRDAARRASRTNPRARLERVIAKLPPTRSLKDRLLRIKAKGQQAGVIAEVKKASPSAGLLRELYQPAATAALYEQSGAIGISVLTEPLHFLGRDEDLSEVRRVVKLPVLRKDFIADPYQVFETRALGADIILLIAAGLSGRSLKELYRIALSLGLEVIAEAHTREELDRVLALDQAIIGINSRNLNTLKTDLVIARTLAPLLPRDRPAIAESGIKSQSDIADLHSRGYNAVLVGELLMRSGNPGALLRSLTGQV